MTLRGVILAGGSGSRLAPLTRVVNKHLLPVGGKPMIYHPIERLAEAGIREILVVTGVEHMGDVVNQLRSGREFGCDFTYRVQEEPGGIAQALSLAKDFARGEPLLVVLGDNIFTSPLAPHARRYAQTGGAMILLKEVVDPGRFGVARLEGDRVVEILEKPAHPPSPCAVTGIYLYDATVFDKIQQLAPSARGELEITDVNNAYIAEGRLSYSFLAGPWSDAGTHASLAQAQEIILAAQG